ncbi:hypothetical protein LGQ02_08735 [Bacillus shivajii]|uniref:hypothetical protein n=1 Tax=Bacillus shivajii TaxID=1983719 RepID=UPI001CF9554B|nr:hypothetical protein [Bacillus shivajii]UCZ54813.1 hypothetical protein LGQ02_08735 [Bacillus shivajii]
MNEKHFNNEQEAVTTADWYFLERDLVALNSPHRPKQYEEVTYSFRQTKFPYECKQ